MSFCYQCQGIGSYTKLIGNGNSEKSWEIQEVTCERCYGKGLRSPLDLEKNDLKIRAERAMEKAIEAVERFKKEKLYGQKR